MEMLLQYELVFHRAFAVLVDQRDVVRDHQHARSSAGELFENVDHHRGVVGVEARRRFVRNDDLRPVHEGARDGDAAEFPAGERARVLVGELFEAHGLEKFERAAFLLPDARRQVGGEPDVVEHREGRENARALRHEADRAVP